MNNLPLHLIFDNLRSAQNVGSILRSAEGFGVASAAFCGITPHPHLPHDTRPPHVAAANHKAIIKTALGAEERLGLSYHANTMDAIAAAREQGFTIVALEQAPQSIKLPQYRLTKPTALILGPEVTGMSQQILGDCDAVLEIPMAGTKESFGVAVATGIALYALRTN